MNIYILFIFFTLLSVGSIKAQSKKLYSIENILLMASNNSGRSKIALNQKDVSRYQYLTYRTEFRPQVTLYGNAPVYNKEYFSVRQPDGTIKFQSISQSNNTVGLGVSQKLLLTGGELSINTDISRFDDFKLRRKQYNGTPVYLRFSQPLFAVNTLKWQKRIEPLRFDESRKRYNQEMENISQDVIVLFFDALAAQDNIEIAQSNLVYSNANYEIEKKRVDIGTTTEDKLLQLELQTLGNQKQLEQARYDWQVAQLRLKSFVGYTLNDTMHLLAPSEIPNLNVTSSADAIMYAQKNRAEFVTFLRKKYESQKNVASARFENQEVNMVFSYGFNNVGERFNHVYNGPLNDQQRFSISFNIPIIDWGRRQSRYAVAKATEKLIAETNGLDESNIYQEILTVLSNIKLLATNIELARKTDSLAKRRFEIANSLYLKGKLSVTELNLAQNEKDYSRKSYISALRAYWDVYYLLRRLTLYDFKNGNPIDHNLYE